MNPTSPGSDGIGLMNDVRRMTDAPGIFLSVYGEDETAASARFIFTEPRVGYRMAAGEGDDAT